jgi:hypothetical protein
VVFETRDPARRAWEGVTPELTRTVVNVSGVGEVESWAELTEVAGQFVTFRSTIGFRRNDIVLESVSTLRFRNRPEVEASLLTEGFEVVDVRDAPDRPGLEFVFLATLATSRHLTADAIARSRRLRMPTVRFARIPTTMASRSRTPRLDTPLRREVPAVGFANRG